MPGGASPQLAHVGRGEDMGLCRREPGLSGVAGESIGLNRFEISRRDYIFGFLCGMARLHMGKTAVVIIHGIGEQRPMGTVSGFTRFFAGNFFRSKPDPQSPLFELRRLSTYVDDEDNKPERELVEEAQQKLQEYPAGTVFYEFYWAFHYRDTRPALVTRWVLLTLGRLIGAGEFSRRGRKITTVVASCVAVALVFLLAVIFVAWGVSELMSGGGNVISGTWKIAAGILLPRVACALRPFFIGWVGDAARYLGSSPDNPIERQQIRAAGIDLLRRLHEDRDIEKQLVYDTIVLMGHSLGSVIAYDILQNYWLQVNREIKLDRNDTTVTEIEAMVGSDPPATAESWNVPQGKSGQAYQALQAKLMAVVATKTEDTPLRRTIKDVWRVRDFVTLGCPLTYARLILANNGKELFNRQQQRELPTCPPTKDRCADETGRASFVFTYTPITGANCLVPDQAAPFLLTRWTNLYFPQDPIGGPLRPIFGWGIRDEVVQIDFSDEKKQSLKYRLQYYMDHFFGGAHVRYWELLDDAALEPTSVDCAAILRKIVRGN